MRAPRYPRLFTLLFLLGSFPLLAVAEDATTAPTSTNTTYAALPPETQGDLLMARGNFSAALVAYQQGSPQSAELCNKIGMAYHHLFALEQARKYYQKAIALNPHYGEALNNLAAVYHGEHDYKLAEKTYKKALKYDPNSAVTYSNLGTAYLSDGKYKLGAQAYQKAVSLNPNVFDPKQARLIDDAGTRNQRADVNYYLAKTYATAGNVDQAMHFLRRAVAAGFNDRHRLMEDKDFTQLRNTPEFQQMMDQLTEPHPRNRAAS